MDPGIADTINRIAAQKVASHLDLVDWFMGLSAPWQHSAMADTFMGANDATNSDRAWLFGIVAARTPRLDFDGDPADGDWENLLGHLRAEILSRRDPETPSAEAAETRSGCVV